MTIKTIIFILAFVFMCLWIDQSVWAGLGGAGFAILIISLFRYLDVQDKQAGL